MDVDFKIFVSHAVLFLSKSGKDENFNILSIIKKAF